MSHRTKVVEEFSRLGWEYGRELAEALLLASRRGNANRALKQAMTRIVIRQIDAAVARLRKTGVPPDIGETYQQNARRGVRDELAAAGIIAAEGQRRAA